MIRQEEDQVKKLLQKNLKDNVSVRSYSLTKNPADTFLCEQHIECSVQATGSADKIYANLTIGLNAESDAFKTEKRFMPIEFPFTQYNVSSIDLIIPEGYKAEDVPTSMEIILDNNNGSYNYIVEQTDDKITISTITRVNKAIFSPNEFDVLQKFFNHINTVREQPIVLSKK